MKKNNESGSILIFLIMFILCLIMCTIAFFAIEWIKENKIPQIKSTVSIELLKTNDIIENQNQTLSITPIEEIKKTTVEETDNNIIDRKFYYNKLNDYSKIIYESLENNKGNLKSGTYKIDFGEKFNSLLHGEDGEQIISNAFQTAVSAFMYDNVDVFYIDVSNMSFKIIATTWGTNTTYTTYLENADNQNYLSDNFTVENIDAAINEVEKVRSLIINSLDGMTDYEKVKQVHDILINSYTYDTTMQAENTHDIYGALVKNVCVCDGYAKSLKYVLDELNIPCIIVMGTATDKEGKSESHAWNYVYLGGNWYGIDTTWDDPIINGNNTEVTPNKYRYDYFLKGKEVFNNESYAEAVSFSNSDILISYPELSENGYT